MKKPPTAPSIAEFYHELTKYSPENLSANVPDPLQKPPPFREYLSERVLDLKPYLKAPVSQEGPEEVSRLRRSISRLLYHTGGITDIVESQGGTTYFRAAPSAGALYPIEIYLAARGLTGLPDGIHSYSPREHSLSPAWEGDFWKELEDFCFRHPAVASARMLLIMTGVFQRSAWRYRERAYRRILLDAGHVLANAAAYAPVEGLEVVVVGGFHDAALNDLLFLEREEEAVLLVGALVPRRGPEPVLRPGRFPHASPRTAPPTQSGEKGLMILLHSRSGIEPGAALREAPREGLGKTSAEGAGSGQSEVSLEAAAPSGPPGEALASSIGSAIRRRRSTRAFNKGALTLGSLAGILRAAYQPVRRVVSGSSGAGSHLLLDPTMISTHLVATRVEGLPAGLYRLDPARWSLALRRKGNFQTELWNLCLGQDLARDAAAAVIHLADLPACVERYGERAYRYLHLDAGHLGERINLAAVGREVGVSGIGGFFDEEVNQLLDLPERVATLYITLLGQPVSRPARE